MANFIIYDNAGKILKAEESHGPMPDDIVDNVSTFILECEFDIHRLDKFIVEDGSLREKTQDEINAESRPLLILQFRETRNALLAASDWTQTPDSPLSETQQQSWRDYRQALRDLPANTTDPANPTWPTKPT